MPELIQQDMTAGNIVAAASNLLTDAARMDGMRLDLASVRSALTSEHDPLEYVADSIGERLGCAVQAQVSSAGI